jgi:CBS domain-containing protein
MKVSKLMTTPLHACRSSDFLDAAARLMWDHDLGAVPVIDDKGRLVGIVTDRDIAMAAYLCGDPLRSIHVLTTMSPHVIACLPDDEVSAVASKMSANQIRRMPVIDEHGRPIGMVSLNDLARAVGRNAVTTTEVASTLAAVSAPRRGSIAA